MCWISRWLYILWLLKATEKKKLTINDPLMISFGCQCFKYSNLKKKQNCLANNFYRGKRLWTKEAFYKVHGIFFNRRVNLLTMGYKRAFLQWCKWFRSIYLNFSFLNQQVPITDIFSVSEIFVQDICFFRKPWWKTQVIGVTMTAWKSLRMSKISRLLFS